MASPSSLAGYSNGQLTAPPFSRCPYHFARVPGQAPTIIGLRYKEEPPGAKSRLPISLSLSCQWRPCKMPRKSVACFRTEIYRLGPGTTRRGVSTASCLEWPCRSSWISNTSTASSHRRRRPSFFGVRKNTLEGKKESGPMNTQTRLSDRFSLSLDGGLRGSVSFATEKMIIHPDG